MKSNHFKEVSSKISNYSNNLPDSKSKTTNINVLLNRVKTKQKIEYQKKVYFSAAASAGLVIFGFLIF